MESPVEKLNKLKEKELELKKQQQAEGKDVIKDNDADPVVDERKTFTQSPADKARTHKGHIGTDHEPGAF